MADIPDYKNNTKLKRVVLKCYNCGGRVDIKVTEESKKQKDYDTRRICQACQTRAMITNDDDPMILDVCCRESARKFEEISDIHAGEMLYMTPVKIIKPGDKEFNEIAQQCTPPSEIIHRNYERYFDGK